MSKIVSVASFWAGSPLSFFERVCIQSFLDHGYKFYLYTLGNVENIPSGVVVRDASEVFSANLGKSEDVRFNMGVYSDVFRIHMMKKTDHMWVDLDVYCARKIDFEASHYFGVVFSRSSTNNCVLKLPKDSMALQLILNFFQAEVPIPFWWQPSKLSKLMESYKQGVRPTLYSLPWTTTGPNVLTWALRTTGEIKMGQHWHTYYQHVQASNYEFLQTGAPMSEYEGQRVRFVHLYGSTKLQIRDTFNGVPPKGSYVAEICTRHGVNPLEHPIPSYTASVHPVAEGCSFWK